MSDELKPFAWCYQTIAGVIVFQKWPASDKEWAQRNNDVAGATKYPNAHSVTDLYTAADLATLRTQLAAMTAERDEWKQAVKESQDRYARMMAMRDTCAAERNAEYAKVAVLRDALTEISKYPPIHPIATAVGQMARNALEQTQ